MLDWSVQQQYYVNTLASNSSIYLQQSQQAMTTYVALVMHRVVLHTSHAVLSVLQQCTEDRRVILNLSYFTTFVGNYISSGEGTYLYAIVCMCCSLL